MSIDVRRRRLGPLPAFLDVSPTGPVTWVQVPHGDPMWLVTDYVLGRTVLTDARFSRAAAARPEAPRWSSLNPSPNSIMSMDGAAHARLRRLAAAAFTTHRVARQAPLIEKIADELLDTLAAGPCPADLVAGYTAPLPLAALSALLGVPQADRPKFDSSVVALFGMTEAGDGTVRAQHELLLVDYMSSLVAGKRRQPGDDVLSALVQANDGGALSRAELISFGLALLMAGYETTAGQLSMSVLAILAGDAGPGGVPGAGTIEELIRVTPATPMSFPRVATEDVELGGTLIRAGQGVIVSLLHCNYDEDVFPAPERVDGERPPRHVTFGHGVHRCLGAPFARVQLEVALTRLGTRFPGLRLAAGDDAVTWSDSFATRGLARLAVAW
ncbi:cytochrome P450 [Actinoplanes sp. NPDC051470]|uniref:cytochrome P450 n=1 Tax=unclassified Actinoplanes TaxID=2626549 RepID=UPI0034273C0F